MDRTIVAVELEDTWAARELDQVTLTFDCGHTWLTWVPTRDCIGQQEWCPFCDPE